MPPMLTPCKPEDACPIKQHGLKDYLSTCTANHELHAIDDGHSPAVRRPLHAARWQVLSQPAPLLATQVQDPDITVSSDAFDEGDACSIG